MKQLNFKRSVALVTVLLLAAASSTAWANDALNQGLTYFKSGKFVEAAAEFQSLVDSSPSYDYGYFMLGLSFLQMGKAKDAEQNLLKAIELNGDKFEYHNGLGRLYFEQKQFAKAVAALRTAEPLATDNRAKFSLYSVRGFSYASLDKWGDAVEDLEKAKAIDPNNASILSTLGQSYFKLGHYDKAVPVLRQATKANSNDSGSMLLLAEALISRGAEASSDSQKATLYGEALQVAERTAQLKPGYETHNLVGRAALGSKDYGKAEQAFRKVLAQKSDYCYAMVNLGKTYLAQSRWSEAEGILRDAASCSPRMAVIFESLGFSLQKQRKLPEAIEAYNKALNLKPSESIRQAIQTCQQNIEIAEHNKQMDEIAKEQEQAEKQAQAEYEAELRKREEWKKKTERDD